MDLQTTRTWAEIDLRALRANAVALREALPEGSALLGVVKAIHLKVEEEGGVVWVVRGDDVELHDLGRTGIKLIEVDVGNGLVGDDAHVLLVGALHLAARHYMAQQARTREDPSVKVKGELGHGEPPVTF